MDAKSALNAVSDELRPTDCANIQELTYYYVFSAGVVSGAVQPETSHESGYTGTWSPEGSPTSSGNDVVKHTSLAGVTNVRRVRISTVLAGGTVTVWAMGR